MGHTSLELADRVGTDGPVFAVDIAAPMIERAQQRARDAGCENIRFQLADAQTYVFPPAEFDLTYSRFGVMFFDNPVAAFRNLLGALRSGGRLALSAGAPPKTTNGSASSSKRLVSTSRSNVLRPTDPGRLPSRMMAGSGQY